MGGKELWEEVHRLFAVERWSKSAIARELDLKIKTVRQCLRHAAWVPYQRAPRPETLLPAHAELLQRRAPEVGCSARILFQELVQQHGYRGSCETVKRFVRPLRDVHTLAERAAVRLETPPGLQSQIDWDQAVIPFRQGRAIPHIFGLTLGFSRWSFYHAWTHLFTVCRVNPNIWASSVCFMPVRTAATARVGNASGAAAGSQRASVVRMPYRYHG